MTKSTLGFIFSQDLSKVALITKNRPSWQAGKLNGIGGKTEEGEASRDCLSREVKEECDLTIPSNTWHHVAELQSDTWEVAIFATKYLGNESDLRSVTEESVAWYSVETLPENVMSNLTWLIPLSIDILTNQQSPQVTIMY